MNVQYVLYEKETLHIKTNNARCVGENVCNATKTELKVIITTNWSHLSCADKEL